MPAVAAFGLVLRELRRQKGLSQEAVASLTGLEVVELQGLERGMREPTLALIFKLARALGVEPSELLSRMERKLQ